MTAGYVGEQAASDGLTGYDSERRGRLGDRIVSQLHGKYYESARRGRMYYGSTVATGIALIVPATTGNHPTLWNPASSGVDVSIVRVELGYISGANAPGPIEWALTTNAGDTVGTGLAIVTFTQVASLPCRIGGDSNAKAKWAPAVNTYTAAPVFTRTASLNLFTGAAATAVAPFNFMREYDGDLVMAPGNALSLCTQTATTTALFQVTVVWEEIPVD